MKKRQVLVLFGGPSSEHEVSLMSATSVMKQIDKKKYEVIPVGITDEGKFQLYEKYQQIQNNQWEGFEEARFQYRKERKDIFLIPGGSALLIEEKEGLCKKDVEIALPILHGPYGEDGTLQGLLQACRIPYVGAGVMTSALAMDKAMVKKLFESEGIDQAAYHIINIKEWEGKSEAVIKKDLIGLLEEKLGYPMFVKPSRLGSSVGISKASDMNELRKAIWQAAAHDCKVVVEAFIDGREIECAVLGHYQHSRVAEPAEIIPSREFYDYEDKYMAGKSVYQIPANLSQEMKDKVKQLSVQVYRLLECKGLARIDFFLERKTGNLLLNEINTMPGFTKISMYPKMWEASGITYQELISFLLEEAIE
ncbi:D-alanine--D-alanine ligase [Tindallia magadiensis]|uniref:D-alanine--D-alanine ligase n=1 Tax=Tindallia magadiensis TaxID=69895 RepID=A0A1I3CEA4_9FIRM|nr:D-alanine--D-alanine ligase family protein [Tindallia magadiensis]SFH72847.1 D-alanine--D-alanine ligase [Tindallia magadiensis]